MEWKSKVYGVCRGMGRKGKEGEGRGRKGGYVEEGREGVEKLEKCTRVVCGICVC